MNPKSESPKILYKKGRLSDRITGLKQVIDLIETSFVSKYNLQNWEVIRNNLDEILNSKHRSISKKLKDFEDKVDAILAAITVFLWEKEPASCVHIKCADGGYMIAPKHDLVSYND